MRRFVTTLRKANWGKWACAVLMLCAMRAGTLTAQTFTILFSSTAGHPYAGLIQATDGNFYGTSQDGGQHGDGSVFKITPNGVVTVLHSFCAQTGCPDGAAPKAGLLQAADGNFYGTTLYGGPSNAGTIFKITPRGTLTTLYNFNCAKAPCVGGTYPTGGLIQGDSGDFFGTTSSGGGPHNSGTIFKITPGGALTTLHSFGADLTEGGGPFLLVQATDGDFYGITAASPYYESAGTVFKITPAGVLTTLYNFCFQSECADGKSPVGLVQAADGDFYGTTEDGGAHNRGTVFKITPSGTLTTLYSFCALSGCADGEYPIAGLIQATDGDFYGTTSSGGPYVSVAHTAGTVFRITSGGALTTLYSFCLQSGCADGEYPTAALVQATNGNFYGTTFDGGTVSDGSGGTVFSLSVGLGRFVEPQTAVGKVGSRVAILGTDLAGATSVTFNGVPAAFIVNLSGSAIVATVPAGATTGKIQVTTPVGTLQSAVPFTVLP
jgi:uncharacterized repeat protein (TIGR03803 family)